MRQTEGTRIEQVKVIAGKGRDRQIDEIEGLMYSYGGDETEWTKRKGIGYVDEEGESLEAEIHWYEEPHVGQVKRKVSSKHGEWRISED